MISPLSPNLRIGFSGLRVERDQLVAAGEENARRIVGVAGPIGHAARGNESGGPLVAPDFLSGFGLERDHAISGG